MSKKKENPETKKLVVTVLTTARVVLSDVGDLWEIQHLLETVDNDFDFTFESEASANTCIMYIHWRFDISSAGNIAILSDYAEVIENMNEWEFEVVEEA